MIKRRRGISIIEYTLLIVAVVAALLSMQLILKRAVCDKWKDAGDTFGYGRQYETGETGRKTEITPN